MVHIYVSILYNSGSIGVRILTPLHIYVYTEDGLAVGNTALIVTNAIGAGVTFGVIIFVVGLAVCEI